MNIWDLKRLTSASRKVSLFLALQIVFSLRYRTFLDMFSNAESFAFQTIDNPKQLRGVAMPILKLEKDDETKEIEFELRYLTSLSVKERFDMMQIKSEEIKRILRERGHTKPFEIIKRS